MPIRIEKLSYIYDKKASFSKGALFDVSLTVEDGDFFALIGKTGSGKSTLAMHLNGLIKKQTGVVIIDDFDLDKKINLKLLRAKVGIVFQYPESQLFADTVALDVAFGPKNLNIDPAETDKRVREAIAAVGLNYDEVAQKSPFELSGGQMRRVAIAGVLAMKPEILVLDEPTAGLDPQGKSDVMELINSLRSSLKAVVMISHNMDEVARYCNKVALMDEGKIVGVFTPRELFASDTVEKYGLLLPSAVSLAHKLKTAGVIADADVLNEDELVAKITQARVKNNA
jgi:energy-coupling factor transport system ATP-binding protein